MDAEILNAAMAMVLEWGENFNKPTTERLRARYPRVTEEQATAYDALCREIRGDAFSLVEKAYLAGGRTGAPGAGDAVRGKYPLLSDDNVAHLVSQGMYYAWHDNG